MPYPNEHSARLQQPNRFNADTFRRVDDGTIYGRIKVPSTAAVIWGKLKGRDKPADKPIPQALRFPTKNWTAEKARKWLKDNNVKYIRFEPAAGGKKSESVEVIDGSRAAAMIRTILAELSAENWVMEAHSLQEFFTNIESQQTVPPNGVAIETKPVLMRIEGSTAVIPIKGVLMRELPRAFAWWGIEGTSYLAIQEQVRSAVANDAVKSILLEVDSPGGTVPGVNETAETIRLARKQKPVTAVIDDLGASGAYWLLSQADRIESVKNGMAGSIGVFSVYYDKSAMAEKDGVKVHVIRSGPHKGMGVPGAEITEEQIAAVQQIIDGIAENFISAVAAGRNRPKDEVRKWATGQLWLANTAASMGLIDKVSKVKSVVSKEKTMDEMTDQQVDQQIDKNEIREAAERSERARLSDIKKACGNDLEFAVGAWERGLSVLEAKAEYADVLAKRLEEAQKAQPAKTSASGAAPVPCGQSDAESPPGNFLEQARELAAEKGITVTAAMRRLRRVNPALHETFVAESDARGKAGYAEAV